jgi:hypothetical protein
MTARTLSEHEQPLKFVLDYLEGIALADSQQYRRLQHQRIDTSVHRADKGSIYWIHTDD